MQVLGDRADHIECKSRDRLVHLSSAAPVTCHMHPPKSMLNHTRHPLLDVASAVAFLSIDWLSLWVSSQYQRGRNPTRSSPFTTPSTSAVSNSPALSPDPGTNLTRHTETGCLFSVRLFLCMMSFRNDTTLCPNSRQTRGSHPPCLPRTMRGI